MLFKITLKYDIIMAVVLKPEHKINGNNLRKILSKLYEPFPMFTIEGKNIHVPFYFGKRVLNIKNDEYFKRNFKFLLTLKREQEDIVEFCIEHLEKYDTCILNIFCGAGKTVISSYLSCFFKMKTIVVYPLKCLKNSWFETFNKFTNSKVISTDKKYSLEEFEESDIILTMPSQINKLPILNIDLLILDEAHMFCTENYKNIILKLIPKKVIVCTATLERKDEGHKFLLNMCGEDNKITKISTKPFNVYIYKTNWFTEVTKKQAYIDGVKKMVIDYNKLLEDMEKSEERNNFIINTVLQYYKKHKIIILTKRASHVEFLYNKLKENIESIDTYYGNKEKYIDSNVLIGTYGKISTGFDEIGVEKRIDMAIFAMPTLSIEQPSGRAQRSEKPYMIEFEDNVPLLKLHVRKRKTFYIERNGIIEYKN